MEALRFSVLKCTALSHSFCRDSHIWGLGEHQQFITAYILAFQLIWDILCNKKLCSFAIFLVTVC